MRIKYWIPPDSTEVPGWAQDFFNRVPEREFLEVLDHLLKRQDVAVSENILCCMSEENFNEADFINSPQDELTHPFKGVRFSFRISLKDPLEYDVVDHETFIKYLRIACIGFRNENWHLEKELKALFPANGLTF